MSENKAESIQHENYSMKSSYASNVDESNRLSEYPSWNSKADKQAPYPTAQLQGEKSRKQVMK